MHRPEVKRIVLFGLVAAGLLVSAAIGVRANARQQPAAVEFQVNEAGDTYGTGAHDVELPDLVEAFGDDGQTVGYVRAADLAGDLPTSPEEAAALSARARGGTGSRQIPLLDSDGRTVIGTFTVGGDEATVTTLEPVK